LFRSCNLCSRIGGLYKVQTGDTVWTVSRLLATFGSKVTQYDLIKYNLTVDPRHLKPGSFLVVPKMQDGASPVLGSQILH